MNPVLYASLYEVMEKWVEDNLEELDFFFGNHLGEHMAKAASAVIEAAKNAGKDTEEALNEDTGEDESK